MEKKCLLIGINAKYIHTNLAIRYLKAYCKKEYPNIEEIEFSINDNIDNILREMYSSRIDIYAFSCYLWNIEMILKLCSSLKKLNPGGIIILGGPEVSFDAGELMKKNDYIDYIIRGEGEETLLCLLRQLNGKEQDINTVQGITYRLGNEIISTPERPLLKSLDVIPFPYEAFDKLNNKIIYYETSRGCPFNCQYCLSSTIQGVRYFSMERIKQEIRLFVESGVKQVKLVDRTFNCNKKHSLEIIKYIMELNGRTNFHFEIGADLLDDEMTEVLSKAPKHMFQFEIGVQSTNEAALRAVSREMNLDNLKRNVLALRRARNSHLHLDLIAGLPYEDFKSFSKSFDEVHELMPDMLQLGFLKVLKGSGLRYRAKEYGIEYNDFSPYEVLKTKWISYEELIVLKEIAHVLELYYNSGRFKNSLSYIFRNHYSSYFQFYLEFAAFWKDNSLFSASQSTRELYNILQHFTEFKGFADTAVNELFKLDWLLYYNNGNMPESLRRFDHSKIKSVMQEYIKNNDSLVMALFPEDKADIKSLQKNVAYEVFYADVLNNPAIENEYAVFYTKGSAEETKALSVKLSDII